MVKWLNGGMQAEWDVFINAFARPPTRAALIDQVSLRTAIDLESLVFSARHETLNLEPPAAVTPLPPPQFITTSKHRAVAEPTVGIQSVYVVSFTR